MNNKRGVTLLVVLTATIVMLIIMTSAAVIGAGAISSANLEEYKNGISRVQDNINEYYLEVGSLPVLNEVVAPNSLGSDFYEAVALNSDENNKLYVVNVALLSNDTIRNGRGTLKNQDVYLVAENTHNVYYVGGFSNRGKIYYSNYEGSKDSTSGFDVSRNGLVLSLDAGNIASYPGSGSNWFDLSGNANTTVLNNGAYYSSTNGGAIYFDGSDDYANLGSGTSLDITDSVTISTWFKIDADASEGYHNIIGQATGNRNYNLYININTTLNPKARIHLSHNYNGTTSSFIGTLSNYAVEKDKWTNLVAIITPTNGGTHKYYVNGEFVSETKNLGFTSITSFPGVNKYLGRHDNMFKGYISNVLMYNRVLPEEEIIKNYNELKARYGL